MWSALPLLLCLLPSVAGLGCIVKICDDNANNELRKCPDKDGTCGTYRGVRHGGRVVNGVDIQCEPNQKVHAPFDGQMYYWRPFGGQEGNDCADKGVRIEGEGQWQGYIALIAYVDPNFYGGQVKQGQIIGDSIGLTCLPDRNEVFEPYIQLRLYRGGKVVDPTYHLKDCKCTGQICESNDRNSLIGLPFKTDTKYNGVKGWELRCPEADDRELPGGNQLDPSEDTTRAPKIFSPIEGEVIGRHRLRYVDQKYMGCDNDSIFIKGAGSWKGYTVRIYNAQVSSRIELGKNERITQGMEIGQRLTCETSTDSIFVEFRHNGRLTNVTDMILANNCKAPE